MQIFNLRLQNNQLLNQDYKSAKETQAETKKNIKKGIKYTVGKYEKSLREFTDHRVEKVKNQLQ